MMAKRPLLEIGSWIAGIASAAFAAHTYLRPPGPVQGPGTTNQALGPAVPGPTGSTPAAPPSPPERQATPVRPSFDCGKATWKSEKLVCSSSQLAVLDLTLANEFREAVARNPGRLPQLRAAQNTWLRSTRESCDDIPCLQRVYESRIAELRAE